MLRMRLPCSAAEHQRPSPFSTPSWWREAGWPLALGLFLAGCSTDHYRKSADKEVYGIVDQVEQSIFQRDFNFSINTPYSSRSPEDILSQEIISDRQQPDEMVVTIEDALKLAVEHSREYQTEKENVYLTALSLTGERYEFGPQFFANASGSHDRTADGEQIGSTSSGIGLTQFLKTGGSLSMSLANDLLRYYTGDPRRSAVSTMSVNLVQPLLRGAGPNVATEGLKQAERNVIYAIRSYSQFQRQFAVDIVVDFFALLRNKDQLRNAYEDYKRRLETIEYTQARGEAGILSQLEVDEARSEEQTAKNNYIVAATTYLNNLDRFKIRLGLPLTTKLRLDDKALKDLQIEGLKPIRLDREAAFGIAVERQLEMLNEVDRFEDAKRKVAVAANRLKADLNIFGDATLGSGEPTDYARFNFDDIRAGVGIELDLPIDRLRERNDYRATLIGFESAIRSLSRSLDVKKDEIDQGLRNLESLRRSYFIQTNSVAIAQRRVDGEQLSLQAGRRTVRNVRDAQDVLVDSQNQETEALVSHLTAKLQLLLDIGILDTDVDTFWMTTNSINIALDEIVSGQPALVPASDIIPPETIFDQSP